MWKVRCKVSDSVCALCVHVMHVHTACMLPRGSDTFECVRLSVYFWVLSPGGEREAAGAWQAEGQTWCSAEWVSAAGPCSCCSLDIILVHWPGMSHRPGVLDLPLFIKQKKAESNLSQADNNEKQSWGELSCCGTLGGKVFCTFDKMTVFSFALTVFPLSPLSCNTPCISMSISSRSQLLSFPVKSVNTMTWLCVICTICIICNANFCVHITLLTNLTVQHYG